MPKARKAKLPEIRAFIESIDTVDVGFIDEKWYSEYLPSAGRKKGLIFDESQALRAIEWIREDLWNPNRPRPRQ